MVKFPCSLACLVSFTFFCILVHLPLPYLFFCILQITAWAYGLEEFVCLESTLLFSFVPISFS